MGHSVGDECDPDIDDDGEYRVYDYYGEYFVQY